MGVYNGASTLDATLRSVLDQRDCDLEFIVINDGSIDDTKSILDQWATADARLRVVHQENQGLTRSLITGCEMARGEFIARQDCGDVSLPHRFRAQTDLLRQRKDIVMVASGVRITDEHGAILSDSVVDGEALQKGLRVANVSEIKGPPHHGATMFRRDTYILVGGYRPKFVVAQDIDLWMRLAERGLCFGMSEVHYHAPFAMGSISDRRRDLQFALGELAVRCALARASGLSDQALLDAFDVVASKHSSPPKSSRLESSRYYYFVGSCLRAKDPSTARNYFVRAVVANPLHLKALWRAIKV